MAYFKPLHPEYTRVQRFKKTNVNNVLTSNYCHHIPAWAFDTFYTTENPVCNRGKYNKYILNSINQKTEMFPGHQSNLNFHYFQVHQQHEIGKLL